MTNLLADLGAMLFLLTFLVGGLAVWRIGQVVSWRALAVLAWTTRSFAMCVAFIRFCAEERDALTGEKPRGRHEDRARAGSRPVLGELPRTS